MAALLIERAMKNVHFFYYRFRYLLNYMIIGVMSVLLEVALVKYFSTLGLSFAMSVGLGFMAGVFLSFVLNSKLNFYVPKSRNTRTFFAFLAISLIALVINFVLMKVLATRVPLDYSILRVISAGCVFMLSYTAHRRITFNFVKRVGIAVYLSESESIAEVYSKIKHYADFIHIDLVDKSINKRAPPIDLSLIGDIEKTWGLKKMLHIMSKNPIKWINKLYRKVDIIIVHMDISEPLSEVIRLCRKMHKKVGVALTVHDDLNLLKPYFNKIDFVQVMGISHIGESGKALEAEALDLLEKVNSEKKKYRFEVIFDGGVKPTNIGKIRAKYITAASGILTSSNPARAFLDIKTSARYHDITKELRRDIISGVKSITEGQEYIESGTIVGSFAEGKKLDGISDIDTIIIVDELTKKKFDEIMLLFDMLAKKITGKYGYKVMINNTLGPLKYNKNNIVFHVMVYDKKRHAEHCLKSPFTCYDWQLSKLFFKKPMSAISTVTYLQPNYFFNARRSAEEYLKEVRDGRVSYRYYSFDERGNVAENKDYKKMRQRGKIEFAYHIVRFLMCNFLKMHYKENRKYGFSEMLKLYFKIFPKNKFIHKRFIKKIYYLRDSRKAINDLDVEDSLKAFLKDFEDRYKELYGRATRATFFRHARTTMNKPNLFIGMNTDVPIIKPDKDEIENLRKSYGGADFIKSSPARRCIQSASLISSLSPVIDARLSEINYGNIDGKDLDYLRENYPNIIQAWESGDDPQFPNGENSEETCRRGIKVLESLREYKGKKGIVFSHNVLLRCLVGHYANIPMKDWFKINIPHLKPIEFLILDDRIYLNIEEGVREEIFKNFSQ